MTRVFRILPGRWLFGACLAMLAGGRMYAGGSGLNLVLVVNQKSSNSVILGNYYAERRQIPPENVLRINWTGNNVSWTLAQYQSTLAAPLQAMLVARGLTNQIDYVALSMDIPYRITSTGEGVNSTTSALFYGFKGDPRDPFSCPMATNSYNSYATSESAFRLNKPTTATNGSFLTMLLTGTNLAQAKRLVDAGVNSDGTFPGQTALLARTTDTVRNFRFLSFDDAIFDTKVRGGYSLVRTNTDAVAALTNLLGLNTGLINFTATSNTFVPGAMADSLTSFGGYLFESSLGQTTLLPLIGAGAAGSYGTIVEPCTYPHKFPSPFNYFYQARGFDLAESYYQSITNPYQGLLVGEPLAAPFARPGSVTWTGLATNAVLRGVTNLVLQLNATNVVRPLQQVDLFLDGKFLQTVTNLGPQAGNTITLQFNGASLTNTVPPGATLTSLATALANAINDPAFQSLALVRAVAQGDRLELRSQNTNQSGLQLTASATTATGSGGMLSTFATLSRTNFLDSPAGAVNAFIISGGSGAGAVLTVTVTLTNGSQVMVSKSNNGTLTTRTHTQQLLDLINATVALQGSNGVIAEGIIAYETVPTSEAHFILRSRAAGLAGTGVRAQFTVTAGLTVSPAGTNVFDDNLDVVQPRNHLYLTAGTTNRTLAFAFNSAALADGSHELAAVAYEGSHLRTQSRVTRNIVITNTPLAAQLVCLVGGTNAALETLLQFAVVANTNAISKIEIFSTGGSFGAVSNQSTAYFSMGGTNLGLGLHPFYALVTDTAGRQYRTETKYVRLVGPESPFLLKMTLAPTTLHWAAVAGRRYDVMSAAVVTNPLTLRATVTPTNAGPYQWLEPLPTVPQRIYRVRLSP